MAALIIAAVVIFALAFAVTFLFAILMGVESGYTPQQEPRRVTVWNMPITKALPIVWANLKKLNRLYNQ